MRIRFVALFVVAVPTSALAQDEPPRPLDELIAEFIRSPGTAAAPKMISGCRAEPGTWRRELLGRLLALGLSETSTEALAVETASSLERCDYPELDAWFRDRLNDVTMHRLQTFLAFALYQSGKPENRAAARAAVFDHRRPHTVRYDMAAAMTAGQSLENGLEMIATGYREHGTAPPNSFVTNRLAVLHDPGGERYRAEIEAGRREVLQAVLARPNGSGAVSLFNSLVFDALKRPNEPWFQEVGRAVREIATGQRAGASAELREFAAARLGRFGG